MRVGIGSVRGFLIKPRYIIFFDKLQTMSGNSLLDNLINFLIFTHTDDDYQYVIALADKLVYNAQTSAPQFDFQETGKLCASFISQKFSITAFCFGKGILADFLDCLADQNFLAPIQFSEIIQGFREICYIPAHSNSISSVDS